jgi:hypothetical protein
LTTPADTNELSLVKRSLLALQTCRHAEFYRQPTLEGLAQWYAEAGLIEHEHASPHVS